MIQRLYNLYRSPPQENTPTERFVTEGLAGILERNSKFRELFLQEFCQQKIAVPEITTEISHPGFPGRIDLEVQGESTLIFIEVKVDSGEEEGQLQRYLNLLEKLKKIYGFTDTHLLYLTRDNADAPDEDEVHHIFWSEVRELLKKLQSNDSLISSYNSFLSNLISPMKPITENDLHFFRNHVKVCEMIDGIMSILKLRFIKHYGEPSESNQVIENKRKVLLKRNILEGEGYSELGLGLYFVEDPFIRSHIYVAWDHPQYKEWLAQMNSLFSKEYLQESSEGMTVEFKKELEVLIEDYLARDKLTAIADNLLQKFDDLIEKSQNLGKL